MCLEPLSSWDSLSVIIGVNAWLFSPFLALF